jgi:hypothetical protein
MVDMGSKIVGTLRFITALAGTLAIVSTFADTSTRVAINPFNFFGFFTMQSNILTIFVLILAGYHSFLGRLQSPGFQLARASVTTYIVIVGIVYNTLLAGLEGGVSLAWANWVLHVALPIYMFIDWMLVGDRSAQPWKKIWVVLIYPAVWIAVVLVRGATDGWVPYPFLDPQLGYGVVALYCLGILIAIGAVATWSWAISRVKVIKV